MSRARSIGTQGSAAPVSLYTVTSTQPRNLLGVRAAISEENCDDNRRWVGSGLHQIFRSQPSLFSVRTNPESTIEDTVDVAGSPSVFVLFFVVEKFRKSLWYTGSQILPCFGLVAVVDLRVGSSCLSPLSLLLP